MNNKKARNPGPTTADQCASAASVSHKFVAWTLSFLLAFPPAAWAQAAGNSGTEKALAGLQKAHTLAGQLRNHINRSAFDLEAILDKLDYDADSIIAFVKQQIAFEQYNGLLRGAQGTLMSQAGNSLDQSLLLAKLLRDAGYDARIVRGKLDPQAATELVREMARQRPNDPELGNVGAMITSVQNFGFLLGISNPERETIVMAVSNPPQIRSMLEYQDLVDTSGFISSQLESAGVQLASPDGDSLLREASDYFWVEHKVDDAQPWQSVHPAFHSKPSFQPPKPLETMADSVPDELQHRLRVQVFIERHVAGKLEVLPVTDAWERPVANLVGQPLVIANLPDSLLSKEGLRISPEKALETANFFVPTFGNSMAGGASYFDLAGNIVDPEAAGSAAAGVIKQVGEGFTEALGALTEDKGLPALTAQWLEITIIGPGGTEQKSRRTLFDRIGPAARSSGKVSEDLGRTGRAVARPLMQSHTIFLAAGRTPRGMAADEALVQLQSSQPGYRSMVKSLSAPDEVQTADRSEIEETPVNWAGHLALLSRFDLVESFSPDHRIYHHEPMVVIHSSGLGDQGGAIERIDIVQNPRRAVTINAETPAFDPEAVMTAGIWETLVEGSLVSGGDKRMATQQVIDLAGTSNIPIKTIVPGQDLPELSLDVDSLHFLQRDLDHGYAVIVPESTPKALDRTGWWRVDTRTGITLGQLDDGRGADTTEYKAMLFFSLVGLALFKYQQWQCVENYTPTRQNNDVKLVCCFLSNWVGFTAGALLGTGLMALRVSEIGAGAIGLGVDAADIGFGLDNMVCNAIID